MTSNAFKVSGLHCSSCSMLITMNVEDLAGVSSVTCDHATGNTVVEFDESITNVTAIRDAIIESGYSAELVR